MAATRKLQGEIDRCLKKVTEGVETFEDIWQKVHNATNSNQKEKYEADLKKEIKKLQRLRDQIKSWITSGEIKDKSALLDYRKLIETVCSSTFDSENYPATIPLPLARLSFQHSKKMQMERFKVVERETKTKAYSKEGLGAAQKLDPAQKERDDMREWLVTSIDALNIQVDQFESEIEGLVAGKKKRLDKEKQDRMDELRVKLEKHRYHIRKLETILRMLHNMSVEVGKLKDIKDDVEYYIDSSEEPDFKENEFIYDDIIGLEEVELSGALAGSADSGDTGATPTSTVSDVTPPPVPPSPSAPGQINHSSDSRNQDAAPAKLSPVVKPMAVRAVANNNSVTTGMGKPVSSSTPMKLFPTPNNSSPSSGLNHAGAGGNFAAVAAAPTPAAVLVNATINSKPTVSHTAENGSTALSNALSMPVAASQVPNSNNSSVLTSNSTEHAHMNNSNSGSVGGVTNNAPSSTASSSGADSSRASPLPSPSPPGVPPQLQNGPIPNKQLIDGMSSLKLMAQQAVEKSGLEVPQDTCDALIPPILGVAPLGTAPLTKEQQYQFQLLDAAYFQMPHLSDTERVRTYIPRNPVNTPHYYIQSPLPLSDTAEFFQRLSTETLFFIFYYMEGTKAQYLSAKALKKQSWRFHTKYMMWFQRHEEPKVINEEYEQGTYIYFDYEKWSQKKKEGFTFEYKFLEDRDLN